MMLMWKYVPEQIAKESAREGSGYKKKREGNASVDNERHRHLQYRLVTRETIKMPRKHRKEDDQGSFMAYRLLHLRREDISAKLNRRKCEVGSPMVREYSPLYPLLSAMQ